MINLINASDTLPITMEEIKNHLRLDHHEEDNYLQTLIRSATRWVENYTQRSLLWQQWQVIWQRPSQSPSSGGLCSDLSDFIRIPLPFPPLMKVNEVNSVYFNGRKTPIRRYVIEVQGALPALVLSNGPTQIEVIYETGYGNRPNHIPADIRQAILIKAADFYQNRENIAAPDNTMVHSLLNPYRMMRLCS